MLRLENVVLWHIILYKLRGWSSKSEVSWFFIFDNCLRSIFNGHSVWPIFLIIINITCIALIFIWNLSIHLFRCGTTLCWYNKRCTRRERARGDVFLLLRGVDSINTRVGASTTTTATVAVNYFIGTVIVNGTFEFFEFAFFLNNTVMQFALVDGQVNVIDLAFFDSTASVVQWLFWWTVLGLNL